eukprot:SAG22_NODE_5776_length_954_cov_1.460819_1_plen_176_part_00
MRESSDALWHAWGGGEVDGSKHALHAVCGSSYDPAFLLPLDKEPTCSVAAAALGPGFKLFGDSVWSNRRRPEQSLHVAYQQCASQHQHAQRGSIERVLLLFLFLSNRDEVLKGLLSHDKPRWHYPESSWAAATPRQRDLMAPILITGTAYQPVKSAVMRAELRRLVKAARARKLS